MRMDADKLAEARSWADGRTRSVYNDTGEISLFDVWDILVRRRWLIAAIWGLTVLAAVAYLVLATPVFESRSVVRLGRVAGELVTQPGVLAVELRERYQVGEPNVEPPLLAGVQVEEHGILVLTAQANTAAEAQDYLDEVVGLLAAEQQQPYEVARAGKEAFLETVDAQIARLNSQLLQLNEVSRAGNGNEAVDALVVLEQSSLQAGLPALEARRAALDESLLPQKTFPTTVIRTPTMPDGASSPRPALTLALALVLGIILSVMAAFFGEFLHQAKSRTRP